VGAYDEEKPNNQVNEIVDELPACFTTPRQSSVKDASKCNLLMIDAAADFGGTWAEERLYPNLLSQNSYGLYEFSDLPLAEVVPKEEEKDTGPQFIAGWKINHYLHAWVKKWNLRKHIRLNWKVRSPTEGFNGSKFMSSLDREDCPPRKQRMETRDKHRHFIPPTHHRHL
jgi:hypothetical protein